MRTELRIFGTSSWSSASIVSSLPASAAIQSLNLALGLPETTGVVMEGVAP